MPNADAWTAGDEYCWAQSYVLCQTQHTLACLVYVANTHPRHQPLTRSARCDSVVVLPVPVSPTSSTGSRWCKAAATRSITRSAWPVCVNRPKPPPPAPAAAEAAGARCGRCTRPTYKTGTAYVADVSITTHVKRIEHSRRSAECHSFMHCRSTLVLHIGTSMSVHKQPETTQLMVCRDYMTGT